MNRKITGFHQDERRDWVADLECGHAQHVRHNPPWMNRPWVVTPEGRQAWLGVELDCRKCDWEAQDTAVRLAVYAAFAEGSIPTRAGVTEATGFSRADVGESYERLAAGHVLVLRPENGEVWMAMPFSGIPTAYPVTGTGRAWWANCAWDALGIAFALEKPVRIETTCTDCGEPLRLDIDPEQEPTEDWVVHFAVPAAHWWDDIGFT